MNVCWKPSPDIASRKVANEIVLLNVKTSDYYSMNPTAVRVWELICGNARSGEIIKALAEEFDADAVKVRKDVLELIKTLESQKIISRFA
jgi:hypothetical protein